MERHYNPDEETHNWRESDKYEPEPKKYKHDLVEEVHWKSALNRSAMYVAHRAHMKVTDSDAREPVWRRPRLLHHHARYMCMKNYYTCIQW